MDNISADFKLINDKALLDLFNELEINQQKRILIAGIRKAAKPIIDQAKLNFNTSKKGRSTTNYKDLNSSFKIEASRNKEVIGVKVGVKYVDKQGRRNWYKYRWIEWGTNERFIKSRKGKGRSTGKMTATNFFYNAVDARKEQAIKDVSDAVVEQLEKTIKKYQNK